jgi:rubrerythrin
MSTRRPPAKKKPAAKRAAGKSPSGAYADFIAQALAMEQEAAERYDELADQMEVHNNAEVAELFRKMAEVERKHSERVLGKLPRKTPPARAPIAAAEMPETIPTSEAHYLMPAYHALELALESEQRAQKFFEQAERSTRDARVRDAAREMAAEEREHVRLIKDWMKRVPKPEPGWDYDPDPPTYSE